MICVQSPLKRDYIIELLHEKTVDDITFQLHHKDNMKLFFEHTGDAEKAASAAKKEIKKSKYGSALYFTVDYE